MIGLLSDSCGALPGSSVPAASEALADQYHVCRRRKLGSSLGYDDPTDDFGTAGTVAIVRTQSWVGFAVTVVDSYILARGLWPRRVSCVIFRNQPA